MALCGQRGVFATGPYASRLPCVVTRVYPFDLFGETVDVMAAGRSFQVVRVMPAGEPPIYPCVFDLSGQTAVQ